MCADCEARRKLVRDALLRAKIGEAATHALKGVAELAGLVAKTGEADMKTRRRQPKKDSGAAGKQLPQ